METRGMLLHQIMMGQAFHDAESNMPAIRAMEGTAWRAMSMGEGFAYNDMAMIRHINLKGFRCMLAVKYRKQQWYIYEREGTWYVCKSQNTPILGSYDLNRDADVRRFYTEHQIDLKCEYVDGRMFFQTYTMFDVIINYKKFFKLQ